MKQIFVELSQFKKEILEKIKTYIDFQESLREDAEIVISDSLTAFKDLNDNVIKLIVSEPSGIIIDTFYELLNTLKINGCFAKSKFLPDIIGAECFRISNEFISRGLETFFEQGKPIYFDSLYSTKQIGKKIDAILYFCDENRNEGVLRNLLTSQLMLSNYFINDSSMEKIELEFAKDSEKLMISTSVNTNNCSLEKIIAYIKSNRTICRNLLEDASFVSITFSENRLKILSTVNANYKSSIGFNIYSSLDKEENLMEQIAIDKRGGLNYINFSKVEGLIKQEHSLSDAKHMEQQSNVKLKRVNEFHIEQNFIDNEAINTKRESKKLLEENNELLNKMSMVLKSTSDDKLKLEEIEKLQSKQEIMLKRLSSMTQNIDLLKDENKLLKENISTEKFRNLKNQNFTEQQQLDLNALNLEVEKIAKKKAALEGEIERIEEISLSKDDEMKSVLNNLKLSEIEKEKLEKAMTSFERRVHTTREREKDAQESNYRNVKELEEARRTTSSLEQKIKRDETLIQNLEAKIKEIESSGSRNIQIERELRAELQTALQEIREKDREIRALTQETDILKQKNLEREKNNITNSSSGPRSVEDLEQLNRKTEVRAITAEGKAKALQAALEKLEAKEKRLKSENSEFASEITKKDMQTDKLKKDLTRAKTELVTLQIENDQLKQTAGNMEGAASADNKKIEDLKREFSTKERKLDMENQKLTALVTNLKKTNETNERQLNALRDNVNELTRKYTTELNASKKKDLRIKELERK